LGSNSDTNKGKFPQREIIPLGGFISASFENSILYYLPKGSRLKGSSIRNNLRKNKEARTHD